MSRPWGPEPTRPPPEWHDWLLDRENALKKEAEWKEYEDRKKGVEHDIIKFHGASHRLDEAMTRKFQDGVDDDLIPERLVALWWDYDRYVKHSGPEYVEMRSEALDEFYRTRLMSVQGYFIDEQDLHERYPNPKYIKPFTPKKIRLSRRLLERAWPWKESDKPVDKIRWNRLLNQFATFGDGTGNNLVQFKEDIERLVAALPPEETKGMASPYASVVDAVFEAHALKGRVGGV